MTDGRNDKSGKKPRCFGDIPIRPSEETLSAKPALPAQQRSDMPPSPSTSRPAPPPARTLPYPALLLIPVALFLLYFSAASQLVPILIKGPLATQLGRQLNRPVSVADVSFAPLSLRLEIKRLAIGPDPSRKDDSGLCTAAVFSGRVLPTSLLAGKVALEDLHIEQPTGNLVRYRNGSYNIFPDRPAGKNGKGTSYRTLLPPWLSIQGLQLTDGTIIFHDKATGREHHIRQIQLALPAPDPGKTVAPTLSAVINSSPFFLHGQRSTAADGTTETRLSLQLNELEPQQYLAYLPVDTTGLAVTGGRLNTALDITFQDNTSSGSTVSVSGIITLTGLVLQDRNKTFQLKVPAAQMVLRPSPLQHLYSIEKLVIDTPQVWLKNSSPPSLIDIYSRLASFLPPDGSGLEIKRLQIDNGSLKNGNQPGYHALHIQLTGLQDKNAAGARGTDFKPAQLSLTAHRGQSTIAFQGLLNSDLEPTGTLSLQNLEPAQLQPYLPPVANLRLTRGKVGLTGTLLTQLQRGKPPVWKITDSRLQASDFSLHSGNSPLVDGRELIGRECNVQLDNQHISCRQLNVDKAHFTGKATGLLLASPRTARPPDRPFSFNNLLITNSTALVPLPTAGDRPGEAGIKLAELNLTLTGMEQEHPERNNLHIQAATDGQGKVELSGQMQRNGRSMLQVSATDINISQLTPLFSSWPALSVKKGTLQLKGRLKIPDNQFIGSFQLNDCTAEKKGGPILHWPHAAGSGVTASLTPFSATLKEFSLQQPTVRLRRQSPDLAAGLLDLFREENNSPVLPPITIEQCTINNGSLQQMSAAPPDRHQINFSGITGTFAPLQPATPSSFNLSGRMDGADFMVTGRTGITSSTDYTLAVNRFPLAPFAPLFSGTLGIDVRDGVADWYFSSPATDSGWIQLQGLTPGPDSQLAMVLALLTDDQDSFILPVPPQSAGFPARLFQQTVIRQLDQLRLQAIISPRLLLDKSLPGLNLPDKVEFAAGETVPDFMEGLEDYATLVKRRPHLGLVLRGHYDERADRQYLLQILQEAADARRELENLRREKLRTRLLDAKQQQLAVPERQGLATDREELQQIREQPDLQPLPRATVRLPANSLQNLARQRANVIGRYLVDQLGIAANRIDIQQGVPGGTRTDLLLQPRW